MINQLEKAIADVVLAAMSRGGTWAVRPGEKPARKRYAVKQGRAVRRRAPTPFTEADVLENARRIEATRDGADIILVSYE